MSLRCTPSDLRSGAGYSLGGAPSWQRTGFEVAKPGLHALPGAQPCAVTEIEPPYCGYAALANEEVPDEERSPEDRGDDLDGPEGPLGKLVPEDNHAEPGADHAADE